MKQHADADGTPLAAVKHRDDQSKQHRRPDEADAVESQRRQHPHGMLDDQERASPHRGDDKQAEIGKTRAVQ